MSGEGMAVRETLHYVRRFERQTLMFGNANIGTLSSEDIRLLAEDIRLLSDLSIYIILAGRANDAAMQMLREALPKNRFVSIDTDEDLVAEAIAHQAIKICLMCGTGPMASVHGNLNDVSVSEAQALLVNGGLSAEARSVLTLAVAACEGGVPRVQLFDARRHDALLEELFTGHGAGMMVYTGTHKEVRSAQAEDVPSIAEILRASAWHAKDAVALEKSYDNFHVFVSDGDIHGCCRTERDLGTFAVYGLAHTQRFDCSDVFEALLRSVLKTAQEHVQYRVVIPYDQIPPLIRIKPWFTQLGFKESTAMLKRRTAQVWIAEQ